MLLITLPEHCIRSADTDEEEPCYTELQPVSGSLISSSTDPCLGEYPDDVCAEYVIDTCTEDGLSLEEFAAGYPAVYTLPESPQSLSEVSDECSFTEEDLLQTHLYEDPQVSEDTDDDASVMLDLMDLSFLDENPNSMEDEMDYGHCFTDFIDACPTVIVTAARGCTPDLKRFNPSPSPPTPTPSLSPCPSPPTLPLTMTATTTQAAPSVPSSPSSLTHVPDHTFDLPPSPSSSSSSSPSSSSFSPSSPMTLTLHCRDPCPSTTSFTTTTIPANINTAISIWESMTIETMTIPTTKTGTDNNSNNNNSNRNSNNKSCLQPVVTKAPNGSTHHGWRIVQQQHHHCHQQHYLHPHYHHQQQQQRDGAQTFSAAEVDEREEEDEKEEVEVKREVGMDFDTFDHSDDDENDEERDFKPYCGSRRGAKKNLLWKFLLWSLDNHSDVVSWTDVHKGEFRFLDTDRISVLWGQRKKKQKMTFEKLSRAIRHYYKRGLMERLPHTRLLYKFNWDKVPKRYRKV